MIPQSPTLTAARGILRVGFLRPRKLLLEHVHALPAELFEFLRPDAVVREETPFVAPHAEVVDEERARDGWVGGRDEGSFEGGEEV